MGPPRRRNAETGVNRLINRIRSHRAELMATSGLLCLYLAVMSGHFLSIDGLVMWRQALAFTYHHSWSLVPPIWWGGEIASSFRGVGASLQYLPGLVVFPWLSGHVPLQAGPQYDFRLLYGDLLYQVAGAPVWALVTAATAYMVGLTARELCAEGRSVLWAMAFYGLGSPALAASRGDWPQPLVAICWVVGIYACLRFKKGRGQRWLWISAGSVFYGVLARPLEGTLLLPGLLVLLAPNWRRDLYPIGIQLAGWVIGVAVTLLTNWARFGSPLNFGYASSTIAWTTPIWIGFPGAVVSPGRGVLWEFPAILIAGLGTALLWRSRRRTEALVLAGLPIVLFVEACQYFDWIGGWDWGFRFFQPALPLVAVLSGIAVPRLPIAVRRWLPASLLAAGILWNIPAVLTDLLGGYGSAYSTTAANWDLGAYPPVGAWKFLHRIVPNGSLDSGTVDILWFRATRILGWVSLIPFAALLVSSAVLLISSARSSVVSSRTTPAPGELV